MEPYFEVIPFLLGCTCGLLASRRSLRTPILPTTVASVCLGVSVAFVTGEVFSSVGPLAILADSAGVGAGWFAIETLVRRVRAH